MNGIIIKPMTLEEAKELGIDSWGRWECEPSVFDWSYSSQETCFVFEGDVIVTAEEDETQIKENMLVIFPKGMKCTWDGKRQLRKLINSADYCKAKGGRGLTKLSNLCPLPIFIY